MEQREPKKISENTVLPQGYPDLLEQLKDRIRTAQVRASLAVNKELINLYWEIGQAISVKQEKTDWGAKTVEKLSKDLRAAFPAIKGFSLTNVKYMMQFFREYPDFKISQQLVGQIPWGHNILIIQRLQYLEERFWYIQKTIGVAEYETKILESLPDNLKGSLPTIEEIEAELDDKN